MSLLTLVLFMVLSFITLSCSRAKEPLPAPFKKALQAEYDKKLKQLELESKTHSGGWPSDEDCDGALWAGIAKAAGADWVDMTASVQSDGRPTRKPFKDCITPEESATTTSNDMMTGILLGLYTGSHLKELLSLYEYGESNGWVMGFPKTYIARVLLRPNGITLLSRAIYKLSDKKISYNMRLSPLLYGPVQADYEKHLIMVSQYLAKKIGTLSYEPDVVEILVTNNSPTDALAQAMAGRNTLATTLLLNNYNYPSYVRGNHNYYLVHWLFAAKIILENS